MENFWDIAGFIISLVTAVLLPAVLWMLQRERRRAEAAYSEREREYQAYERGVEEDRRDYERRQQSYGEVKEAFTIYADLKQRDVIESIALGASDASVKEFLVSLHYRATYQFSQFSDDFPLPGDIVSKIDEAQRAIARLYPDETREASAAFEVKRKAKQDHTKSPEVQEQILAMAGVLTGRPMQLGETVEIAEEFSDIASRVRVSRAGQGVRLHLADHQNSIWLAGNGKGDIPAVLTHEDKKGCTLSSARQGSFKQRLRVHQDDGTALAHAFVAQMRQLSKTRTTCECGVQLKWP